MQNYFAVEYVIRSNRVNIMTSQGEYESVLRLNGPQITQKIENVN